MRVLGIDPGLTRCGFGAVEGQPGRSPGLLDVGVARTPAELDTARRLVRIEAAVEEWVGRTRPEVVAVERVFAQHNVASVMGTAQAAGVAMLVAARHGLPVVLHTPSEIKAAVTGSGRADKAQVGAMVARILRLDTPPRPADAADALALAIAHCWRGPTLNRYAEAVAAHGAGRSAGAGRSPVGGRPAPGTSPEAGRSSPRSPGGGRLASGGQTSWARAAGAP